MFTLQTSSKPIFLKGGGGGVKFKDFINEPLILTKIFRSWDRRRPAYNQMHLGVSVKTGCSPRKNPISKIVSYVHCTPERAFNGLYRARLSRMYTVLKIRMAEERGAELNETTTRRPGSL
jgi:hypothetical protein